MIYKGLLNAISSSAFEALMSTLPLKIGNEQATVKYDRLWPSHVTVGLLKHTTYEQTNGF